ncbi:Alpha/beta hydrolase fold-1 [Xylariaceae sp. FL0016]|nr:Alpha/beta hydrolase fold-1 [Xylariaceae sp. FL0016]
MSAPKSTRSLGIVFAHGGFHLPACFDKPKARLEAAGFSPVIAVRHPSVGKNPQVTADDDGRNLLSEITPHLDQGVEFLAIAHSYGGTPLTIAAQGQSVAERAAVGKKGGIRALVFVTSNMPPQKGGSALSVLPPGLDIVDVADGLFSANPKAKAAFYGPDMADDEADRCMAVLLPQSAASLMGGASVGTGDITVPAYYIVCEKDQTIATATQETIAASIPTLKRVLRNPGGHTAFLTEMDTFVKQIEEIADEVEKEAKA